jgi:hypothetical protein
MHDRADVIHHALRDLFGLGEIEFGLPASHRCFLYLISKSVPGQNGEIGDRRRWEPLG